MMHHDTAEEPISPQERLGICSYRLSQGDYYHTIAEMTDRAWIDDYTVHYSRSL